LNKPSRLTDEEFDMIKQHPAIGHETLLPVESLSYVRDGFIHHHENFYGSGCTHGLAEIEIPLDAPTQAVADSFDAMISDRPYRYLMPVD
jgi:HD-GYP domain-containing protein (c-di-GMP phosphodiesterase class II)